MTINLNELENNVYTFGVNATQQIVMTCNRENDTINFEIVNNPQNIVVHEDYDTTHQILEKMAQHTKQENMILLLNEVAPIIKHKKMVDSEINCTGTDDDRKSYEEKMRREEKKWNLYQKHLTPFSEKYEDEEQDFLNQDNAFYEIKTPKN